MTTSSATQLDLGEVSETYFAAWEARDPDAIAALHTTDTHFHVHAPGEDPADGREAARANFAQTFERFPDFAFEVNRVLLGESHWVLDWVMIDDTLGVRLPLLDVVEVSPDGLVARKDVYVEVPA
ncbi:MAG: nuclear transport factor 2 family protein [Thermoleophilaceae bacterium]|nr:nuclear transport factor 2 family protein [Thermoleophilaceae bacterium]